MFLKGQDNLQSERRKNKQNHVKVLNCSWRTCLCLYDFQIMNTVNARATKSLQAHWKTVAPDLDYTPTWSVSQEKLAYVPPAVKQCSKSNRHYFGAKIESNCINLNYLLRILPGRNCACEFSKQERRLRSIFRQGCQT